MTNLRTTNSSCQLCTWIQGTGFEQDVPSPVPVPVSFRTAGVACGGAHSAAVTSKCLQRSMVLRSSSSRPVPSMSRSPSTRAFLGSMNMLGLARGRRSTKWRMLLYSLTAHNDGLSEDQQPALRLTVASLSAVSRINVILLITLDSLAPLQATGTSTLGVPIRRAA